MLFPDEEDFPGGLLKLMLLSTSPDLILLMFIIIISVLRVMMGLGTAIVWYSMMFYFFSELIDLSAIFSYILCGFYFLTDDSLTTS